MARCPFQLLYAYRNTKRKRNVELGALTITEVSWYNNEKFVIILQVAFASPQLVLPAAATGEVANYTIHTLCSWYNNRKAVIIDMKSGGAGKRVG